MDASIWKARSVHFCFGFRFSSCIWGVSAVRAGQVRGVEVGIGEVRWTGGCDAGRPRRFWMLDHRSSGSWMGMWHVLRGSTGKKWCCLECGISCFQTVRKAMSVRRSRSGSSRNGGSGRRRRALAPLGDVLEHASGAECGVGWGVDVFVGVGVEQPLCARSALVKTAPASDAPCISAPSRRAPRRKAPSRSVSDRAAPLRFASVRSASSRSDRDRSAEARSAPARTARATAWQADEAEP
jgi:hypothetical protein